MSGIVFSIDVEDWYQGLELPLERWSGKEGRLSVGLDRILDLLDKSNTRATFFTLGWIAENEPDVVRRIVKRGHELASHGYSHAKVYDLSPKDFRAEVRDSKRRLEDLAGHAVTAFRAPFFSITSRSLWALDILREESFTVDCSISPSKTWRYGIASSPSHPYRIREVGLVEFPVSTWSLLGRRVGIGGAYFRIMPYALTRAILRRKSERGAMFYAHPWEYDPDHPVLKDIEPKAKFTHYANLASTAPKTARLLEDFKCTTLSAVISSLEKAGQLPSVSIASLR